MDRSAAHPREADDQGPPYGRIWDLIFPLPSVVGAWIVFAYFNWVDPVGPKFGTTPLEVWTFAAVSGALLLAGTFVARRWLRPVVEWLGELARGGDARAVPQFVRRRALNAPLISLGTTFCGWLAAGLFYFAVQRWFAAGSWTEAFRVFAGISLVGGPIATALSFLVSEMFWRQRIPIFYPDGHLDRLGVIRISVFARLAGTFLVMAVLPPVLMLVVTAGLVWREGVAPTAELERLLGTHAYVAAMTGLVSAATAFLVTRFINRPVQALRGAMARVANGELSARVPVRSTDELGELGDGFNRMVAELEEAARVRELFGRYVSAEVAKQALERGIALGGELVHATAMFVDLRGFTAMTRRTVPSQMIALLSEYHALVEGLCDREGGIVTQFLGDGVVAVFGAPLRPQLDHARRAVETALAIQRALAVRNLGDGEPLLAGIGIATGDVIAGNVGTSGRVTYTIVGDAVNQAARLQVKTRELGAPILITEATRAELGAEEGLVVRPCGLEALKGIASPIAVYAIEPFAA